MKRFLVLSAVLSLSASAATIGTCVPGALSSYIGNACAPGDKVFDNFQYSGDADTFHFQMASTAIFLEPLTGASFFTAQSFADRIAMVTIAQGHSGQLVVADSPDPADTALTNAIVTTSILTGPDGTGAASPGLSLPDLAFIQTDAVVPEPASFGLIGIGLLCLGLLQKRLKPALRFARAK